MNAVAAGDRSVDALTGGQVPRIAHGHGFRCPLEERVAIAVRAADGNTVATVVGHGEGRPGENGGSVEIVGLVSGNVLSHTCLIRGVVSNQLA